MADDDNNRLWEERFSSLEESSRSLAADVRALTATIQVVNELQQQQRAQAEKLRQTDQVIASAKVVAAERDRRNRNAIRMVSTGLGILLPLVSILVYWSLIVHVNDLINANRSTSYASCQLRNTTQLQNAAREQKLADLEANKQLKAIHQQSADQLKGQLADCSRWAPSK